MKALLTLMASVAIFASTVQADLADAPNLEPLKGEKVVFHFRTDDWKLLKDKKEFSGFFDQVYDAMAELTGGRPPMILRGHQDLGAWGTAGLDGVRIDWGNVPQLLEDFNSGKVEFGLVHEMGHVFDARDFPRWYITPGCAGETFANIKLSYALERLLREEGRYRIEFGPGGPQTGRAFNDNFYLNQGDRYLQGAASWVEMGVDELHSFHLRLVRRHGWDIYKKWFRACLIIDEQEGGHAPEKVDDPVRIQVACALLSRFSGEDLVPFFQSWRMPVTVADITEVTTRYQLDRVADTVDNAFAREFVRDGIHLDPLSLAVRIAPSGGGKVAVSFSNIFGKLRGVNVRYTIDGGEVGADSKIDTGAKLEVASGTEIRAALYIPGRSEPVLTRRELATADVR
jgi:hypothetical protein